MSSVSSVGGETMGKDQFLELFTTQVRMQDPMNPLQTNDFLAQLAQFTSLEQMSNLNTCFDKMLAVQQTAQAAGLVGKSVSYRNPSEEAVANGRVSAVRLTPDGPALMLGNRQINVDWVTAIYEEQNDQ